MYACSPRSRAGHAVDDLLGGWQDAHGEAESLEWLLARAAAWSSGPALGGAYSSGSPR